MEVLLIGVASGPALEFVSSTRNKRLACISWESRVSLSSITFQIDPSAVLGIGPDATLEQIRDAYRLKVKRHHPDAGGEDWAFRVVSQAYQVLSQAASRQRRQPRVGRAVAGVSKSRRDRRTRPAHE